MYVHVRFGIGRLRRGGKGREGGEMATTGGGRLNGVMIETQRRVSVLG